jgi:DHA3 family macrolide efflux protein-like MFS transporter
MNGVNYLCTGATSLVGPVGGAFLLGFWRIQEILWIDVATFIIALVPLLMVTIPSARVGQQNSSFRQEFFEGFSFIRKARGLMPLLFVATALNFLITPLSTLLSYYVKFDHLGGASDFALVSASVEGGILAGGLVMSLAKGFKRKMVVTTLSIYVFFLGYAVIALAPTGAFWIMAVSGTLATLFIPIANVTTQTIMQTIVPLDMQGRANSVVMALASAAMPVGMILSGPLAMLMGTAYLFLGCALLGMLTLTLAWFFTDIRHVEENVQAPISEG